MNIAGVNTVKGRAKNKERLVKKFEMRKDEQDQKYERWRRQTKQNTNYEKNLQY